MEELKLFVWTDVLRDYTAGMMVALAPDLATARQMLLQEYDYLPSEDIMKEPQVVTFPAAFIVWGGG